MEALLVGERRINLVALESGARLACLVEALARLELEPFPERREAAMKLWSNAHAEPTADVVLIADHIEHVAAVAGHDHVGIGGDLDGIGIDEAPAGMNSVAGYPLLFAELIHRGWSDKNLARLAGGNILRVMRRAEAVAASMKDVPPSMATLEAAK